MGPHLRSKQFHTQAYTCILAKCLDGNNAFFVIFNLKKMCSACKENFIKGILSTKIDNWWYQHFEMFGTLFNKRKEWSMPFAVIYTQTKCQKFNIKSKNIVYMYTPKPTTFFNLNI